MLNQESTLAGNRVLLPLLIVLVATAASSHPAPTIDRFAPSNAPDSLNVERVGEIVLISPPKGDDLPDADGTHLFPDGTDLYLAGDHALMGDFRGIVHIVDISDPTAPLVSGFWQHEGDFSNVVHDVFIRDRLAVVSDLFSGLVLLDLTDPDAPTMLAALPCAEGIHSA